MLLPQLNKSLIVYADDDEDDLDFVVASFARYATELEVCAFQSGYAAYNFLLQSETSGQKPCLIILDINMPGMSGKELLTILRGHPFFDDTPIILFTTSNLESDAAFAKRHKAGFITKPIGSAQMEVIAEEFLSHCSEELKERIKR